MEDDLVSDVTVVSSEGAYPRHQAGICVVHLQTLTEARIPTDLIKEYMAKIDECPVMYLKAETRGIDLSTAKEVLAIFADESAYYFDGTELYILDDDSAVLELIEANTPNPESLLTQYAALSGYLEVSPTFFTGTIDKFKKAGLYRELKL